MRESSGSEGLNQPNPTMTTLDFKEIKGEPAGESFEGLIRLLGERVGLVVHWTGRGSDRGRDLIFVESQRGPLSVTPIRWLVSCKDNSDSNKSVSEKDIGGILDKVRQHGCQGFLLATTTTASTGLKELLDKLDLSCGGEIQTKVWDRFDITKMLMERECADLLLQFFPKQAARASIHKVDAAREIIEASVPRFVSGRIRECLVPYPDRLALLSGTSIWPHDADQSAAIDRIKKHVVSRAGLPTVVDDVLALHFDAFVAFIDRLIRNFPERAMQLLRVVARKSLDNSVVYNVIEIMRESDDFDLESELEITKKCDSETLFDLYGEMTRDVLEDDSVWSWRLPSEVECFDDVVEIKSVKIEDLMFSGGDVVSVSASLTLTVCGHSSHPERLSSGARDFSYEIQGYWLSDGIEIDSIK